ncbi:MAG: sulfur carrier protein ThiS [Lachnospiraceae bacterium]|jgi:thiamine biosynthesis protein ThiS|nr:sulfur carrier protein ThiS [Lachnospiraceae bacterium]
MKINGVQKECPANFTVAAMLNREGFAREGVAVELNMEIVAKDAYDTTVLKEEDVVEVVSFMGGG